MKLRPRLTETGTRLAPREKPVARLFARRPVKLIIPHARQGHCLPNVAVQVAKLQLAIPFTADMTLILDDLPVIERDVPDHFLRMSLLRRFTHFETRWNSTAAC